MATKAKLIYFDGPALGEPIRFLLSYGRIAFEDVRLEREEIVKRKPEFPYGKVPVLHFEGHTLHQSKAISRFLARRLGLAGKSEWDQLECDIMVETINDFFSDCGKYRYEQNEELKAVKKAQGLAMAPFYLDKLDKHLGANGGHFVKDQLTWADFYFASMYEFFQYIVEAAESLDSRPHIKALRHKVINLPGVKEYMAQRPPLRQP